MNDLHIYLLKVSVGIAIISIPYYFLFRNDPNLLLKRFYLLAGLAAAWIIPLLAFQRPGVLLNLTPTVFIDPGGPEVESLSLNGAGTSSGITINWIRVLLLAYLSGLAFMVLKNLFIVIRWNMTWLKNRDQDGIAYTNSDQVFTIFTRIFIPGSLRDEQDLENILLHEKAHVRQLHFVDLTLMELTLLLTWFNPFSWLISRMIKENHEHLADRQVLSTGINPACYRAQLLNHTLGVNVFRLGNQFNHSLTLNRFKMMKKPRKSPAGIIKIAVLIPAILVAMGFTTGKKTTQQKTIQGTVVEADSGESLPGAAIVIAETSMGTVTDHDGTFKLNAEEDQELVISFVGYETIRIKASKITKKPVELKMKTYTMDLEKVPIMVKQTKNGMISINTEVDDPDKPPVFVLDGKVVKGIDHLDPETIKSINVIKNAEAPEAIKYNATHVVLVTTKKAEPVAAKEKVDVLKTDDEVFYVVEEMPSFRGGKADLKTYIYSNLVYPEEAKKKGITGEVQVGFTVSHNGQLKNIKVVRGVNQDLDEAAMEVFRNMPAWKPGKQRNKPVPVNVVIPVRFKENKE